MKFMESTKEKIAPALMIYGEGGIGKSTTAATFPNSIVLNCGARIVDEYKRVTEPFESWSELVTSVKSLAASEQLVSKMKTLVIDDIDGAYKLLQEHIASTQKSGMEIFAAYGGHAGQKLAAPHFAQFLEQLDGFRHKGITVLLLSHASRVTIAPPTGESYQSYGLEIPGLQAQQLKYWCDTIVCAFADVITEDVGTGTRKRTIGSEKGEPTLRCAPSPQFDAVKNCHHLPDTLPLNGYLLQEELKKAASRGKNILKMLKSAVVSADTTPTEELQFTES